MIEESTITQTLRLFNDCPVVSGPPPPHNVLEIIFQIDRVNEYRSSFCMGRSRPHRSTFQRCARLRKTKTRGRRILGGRFAFFWSIVAGRKGTRGLDGWWWRAAEPGLARAGGFTRLELPQGGVEREDSREAIREEGRHEMFQSRWTDTQQMTREQQKAAGGKKEEKESDFSSRKSCESHLASSA